MLSQEQIFAHPNMVVCSELAENRTNSNFLLPLSLSLSLPFLQPEERRAAKWCRVVGWDGVGWARFGVRE
jgi:hypothetical protein